MARILVNIFYYAVVSIFSSAFYVLCINETKGTYVKYKNNMLCLGIFLLHLLLLIPVGKEIKTAIWALQIVLEFALILKWISGDFVKKLVVYIEWNLIMGIGIITGLGLEEMLNINKKAVVLFMTTVISLVLGSIRIENVKKEGKLISKISRSVVVCLGITVLLMLYVISVSMYSVNDISIVFIIYIALVIVIFGIYIIKKINMQMINVDEIKSRYKYIRSVEEGSFALECALEAEIVRCEEIYAMLKGKIDCIYDEAARKCAKHNSSNTYLVNEMLRDKEKYAKEKGIVINYTQFEEIPKQMSQYDIITIIANLIDNAIRAVDEDSNAKKQVDIKVNVSKDKFNLSVTNMISSENKLLKDELGNFITTKKDSINHGKGLQSVKMLTDKYGLHMEIETIDERFRVKITDDGEGKM